MDKETEKKVRKIRADVEIKEDSGIPPNQEVIESLKLMLKEAEEGLIQEMAFVLQYSDNNLICDWVGQWDNPSAMLGQLLVLIDNYKIVNHPSVIFPVLMEEDL